MPYKDSEAKREYYRQYREKNKEKLRAYHEKWSAENAKHLDEYRKEYREENKEVIKDKKKKHREENKEVYSEKEKEKYQNNKEHIKRKVREYRGKNKDVNWEYFRLWSIRKKEKDNEINTEITKEDLLNIINKFDGKCFVCGEIRDLAFDHFYALKYKVPLTSKNCVVLCRECNGRKQDLHPKDFFTKKQLKLLVKDYGIKILNVDEVA